MGSWNATCGLSHLPIMERQPVIGCIICDTGQNHNMPHYPFTNWTPATPIVNGIADHNGGFIIDDSQKDLMRLTESFANKMVSPTEKKIVIQNMQEEYQPDGYSTWMAHRSVFDDLVKRLKIEYRTPIRYGEYSLSFIKTEERKRLNIRDPRGFASAVDYDRHYEMPGPVVEYLWHSSLGMNGDLPKFLFEIWMRYFSLSRIMQTLRITMYPTGNTGSQDQDIRPYRLLQEIVKGQMDVSEKFYD